MPEHDNDDDFTVAEVSIEELMRRVKQGSALPGSYFQKESINAAKRLHVAEKNGQLLPPIDAEEWEDYDFLKDIEKRLIENNTIRQIEAQFETETKEETEE